MDRSYAEIPLHRLLEMFAQKAIDFKNGEREAYGESIRMADEIKYRFKSLNEENERLETELTFLRKENSRWW